MGLAIDGIIVVVYLAAVVGVGLWAGRRQERSLAGYVLGGRMTGGGMPWWAVMASIIAAETSAATFIGVPAEGFAKRGIVYTQVALGLVIGRVVVGMVFLKPYYEHGVYTVYDYLGIRFGPLSKGVASALFLVMRTLASGTRLFVPSLVIVLAGRLFFGASPEVSSVWPYVIAIVGLTVVTTVYTAVGGIRAVIWTDVMQAALMGASALAAVGILLHEVGGWGAVAEHVPEMTRPGGYVVFGWEPEVTAAWMAKRGVTAMTAGEWVRLFLASDYTIFAAVIGAAAANVAAFGTDQDMVQRLLTAPDWKKARRSLITAAILDIPIFATFSFIGVLLIAYYAQHPERKPAAVADVFGNFILYHTPAGLRGLILAGILATAMGSLSAALNSLATSATNDWWLPWRKAAGSTGAGPMAPADADRVAVRVARAMTVVFAVLMIVVASLFAVAKVQNPGLRIIPVVLGVASLILGPMLGVFLLGMLTKRRGSDVGNVAAMAVGIAVTMYLGGVLGLVAEPLRPPVVVSFNWFALIGCAVVMGVGVWFRTGGGATQNARR